MTGEERRKKIAVMLGRTPLSATKLADELGVSRQVIVQDIALLRAEGSQIIATNRGYIVAGKPRAERVFKACHTDEQTREELYLIVDAGGCVEDVYVWHKVYGKICAQMNIDSRRKADEFCRRSPAVFPRRSKILRAIIIIIPYPPPRKRYSMRSVFC